MGDPDLRTRILVATIALIVVAAWANFGIAALGQPFPVQP